MQLNITGHHVDLTAALRSYVMEKLGRVEHYFDHVIDGHVILRHEKFINVAEVTLHAAGTTLFAETEDKDMYAAIDGLADKLERQVKKYKEKLMDHHLPEGLRQ